MVKLSEINLIWWSCLDWINEVKLIDRHMKMKVDEVKWSEVKWSEVKWSEVKWSEVNRMEWIVTSPSCPSRCHCRRCGRCATSCSGRWGRWGRDSSWLCGWTASSAALWQSAAVIHQHHHPLILSLLSLSRFIGSIRFS